MSPEERIRQALRDALATLGVEDADVRLERPRDPAHGDFASNVAMTLAGRLSRAPRRIAEDVAGALDAAGAGLASVEVAGPGFLNFRLASDAVADELRTMLDADAAYGRSHTGGGAAVVVEWVSANPTGPLHLGHGRQAALGDAISSLLEWTGWAVHREFYYNDSGKQMDMLALSVDARLREALGLPAGIPEGGYHGAYVIDVARGLLPEHEGGEPAIEPGDLEALRRHAAQALMDEIQSDLARFGVAFDTYFRESSLYEDGRIEETVATLRATGYVYDEDGAVWLKTTAFGDDKDRVMVRSDGNPTYFLPDVAYHVNKWERGFRHAINVQGSDHHSTVTRVHAGLRALGLPEGYPEYVLHQMVTVERGGQEVKFSKRAGSYTTLRELVDEVGVDVVRYFFQMRRPESHLVFDLDVALDPSDKNPVYKIQYAHARMHSIFGKAGLDAESFDGAADLDHLQDPAERELIRHLTEFPDVVERAAAQRAPHVLCDYLEQTAGLVNSWYHAGNPSRNPELAVLVDDEELRLARLALARAVIIVLRNGLTILGIEAPRRMDREED